LTYFLTCSPPSLLGLRYQSAVVRNDEGIFSIMQEAGRFPEYHLFCIPFFSRVENISYQKSIIWSLFLFGSRADSVTSPFILSLFEIIKKKKKKKKEKRNKEREKGKKKCYNCNQLRQFFAFWQPVVFYIASQFGFLAVPSSWQLPQ